ncbi:hypothetical protein M422DRAFT_777959 [Sphaerobolus stellatus SS14]|uniref:Uncharacterized protein n=1 Tax=Sphaerobolus stellatus (strain SS14) TaxID=990650 RepID=A0A0C9VIL3_SPHS4|nr:hypothetical protein M422DRAFT_777959 [Sphaerobolus stellatus SS14]
MKSFFRPKSNKSQSSRAGHAMNFSDPKQQWGGAVQFPTQTQVGSTLAQYSPAMAAVVYPPKMENARLKASKEYYETQKKASLDSWSDTATLVDCYGNGAGSESCGGQSGCELSTHSRAYSRLFVPPSRATMPRPEDFKILD